MKKLLLSIFVLGLSFLSFSSAGSITYNFSVPAGTYGKDTVLFSIPLSVNNISRPYSVSYSCDFSGAVGTIPGSYRCSMYMAGFIVPDSYTHLTQRSFWSTDYCENYINSNGGHFQGTKNINVTTQGAFISYLLFKIDSSSLTLSSPLSVSCTLSGDRINGECPECTPQYTSEECQTEYDLIPSSDLTSCQSDLASCESFTNGFNQQLNNCNSSLNACNSSLTSCLQSNCPETSGDVARSNIYINDILFPGKPLVNILIPDYITWDYTGSDVSFDVYVGSGYDVDYINSIVDINSYRPSSEDFTNIFVGGLTLIFPYIFIALLILFIRKLVKRIFK